MSLRNPSAVLSTVLLLASCRAAPAREPVAASACLDRPEDRITRITGSQDRAFQVDRPPDDHTYDLRGAVWSSTPTPVKTPVSIGAGRDSTGQRGLGVRTCIVGGTVLGNLDRQANRISMYPTDSLRSGGFYLGTARDGGYSVIDGAVVDNMMDGLRIVGEPPARAEVRNAKLTHIRDDCIEMDNHPRTLYVYDSLLECNMGISERLGRTDGGRWKQPGGTSTTLERVLLYIQPMGPDRESAGMFKWHAEATPRLHIKDSILRYDQVGKVGKGGPTAGRAQIEFPSGTTAENTILIWMGEGEFPSPVPRGLTVQSGARGERTWDDARADWVRRHPSR